MYLYVQMIKRHLSIGPTNATILTTNHACHAVKFYYILTTNTYTCTNEFIFFSGFLPVGNRKNLRASHWIMFTFPASKQLGKFLLLPFRTRAFEPPAWISYIWITWRKWHVHACLTPVSMATWGLHTLWHFTLQTVWSLCPFICTARRQF